ncbi:hypothetical protein B0A49_05202 [Cryomyces minteri]|uniref:ABC transporter domain-containing protein n=1 Tax=Cryomyces minteri TaxID=331657 RepID=A0A4U0XP76_9PEZI|nr:hypothetical protein B0A49_05202 [Cryomyces minteri]
MHMSSDSIAYCAQSPWLRNLTLRENILGESAFNRVWYGTVTRTCGLQTDFSTLRKGDETMVGTKGISLSGGQKNRIALARAVYSRKPVLIVDDILSGLDQSTEKKIFHRVFGRNGILKRSNTTVVLATHSIHWTSYVDKIVVLDSGTIVEDGTYRSLSSRPGYLQHLKIQRDIEPVEDGVETASVHELVVEEPGTSSVHAAFLTDGENPVNRRSGDIRTLLFWLATVGWKHLAVYTILLTFSTAATTLQYIWLKWWAESTASKMMYMSVFVAITLADIVLVGTLIGAHFSFIASTDVGSITNRFSQDISLVDGTLPTTFINTTRGALSFKNLSASYAPMSEPVLHGIDLRIKSGERIGVCGRRGSGKSSLVAVLFGLLYHRSGEVLIDDVDVTSITPALLRSEVVALPQETFFQPGTVRENLFPWKVESGRPPASDERMTAALDEVQLLLKLQDAAGPGQSALDLRLVNAEELLSQGEQQLFCLARAMLMEGKIVVLDECTSSVDIATEKLMQQILRQPPFSDRTTIAIAHRLDTILDFDRVVVMNAGRIVENDDPRILIETEGSLFRALVESQGAAQS